MNDTWEAETKDEGRENTYKRLKFKNCLSHNIATTHESSSLHVFIHVLIQPTLWVEVV